MQVVAPKQSEKLWHVLVPSFNRQFPTDCESEDKGVDNVLMNALTECCSNASTWDTRRQTLLIMADKVTFQTLKNYWVQGQYYKKAFIASRERRFTTTDIPNKVVRVTHRGRPVLGFSLVLLVLTLSRTCHSVRRPSRCPQRYPYVNPSVHCKTLPCIDAEESNFTPLSRRTQLNILSVCSASTKKSLQGLDYISSAGAQAFYM